MRVAYADLARVGVHGHTGGYRFSDFLRIGVPLNLLFWLVSSLVIPWAYPF